MEYLTGFAALLQALVGGAVMPDRYKVPRGAKSFLGYLEVFYQVFKVLAWCVILGSFAWFCYGNSGRKINEGGTNVHSSALECNQNDRPERSATKVVEPGNSDNMLLVDGSNLRSSNNYGSRI